MVELYLHTYTIYKTYFSITPVLSFSNTTSFSARFFKQANTVRGSFLPFFRLQY